jgi:hypothetical protein
MSDPYRLPGASGAPSNPVVARPSGRRDRQRAALWALLVLTAAANSVTSAMAVPMGVSIALGTVSLACIVALVVSHTRRSRS